MATQSSGGTPPPPPPTNQYGQPEPTGKKRNWVKWGILGCLLLVILMGGCVAAIWFTVKAYTEEAEVVVEEFLAAAEAGDYERAYSYFSAPLKDAQSLEELEASVTGNPTLFAVEDLSFNNRTRDETGVTLSGTATLRSGTKVPVSFHLVLENEEWKLLNWNLG